MSREFVIGTAFIGGSILLGGCEAKSPTPILPPSSPTRPSTETSIPSTLTPIFPTRTLIVPTVTPILGLDPKILQGLEAAQRHDNEIRDRIEQAKSGETLILGDIRIRHIASFLWEGGNAYIATLDTGDNLTAVVLSADCLYNRYRDKNQLGNSTSLLFGRIWSPRERLGLLSAKVKLGTGTPVLNAEQVTHGGITESCKEVTAFEKLRELVSRVDWRTAPRSTGEFVGWFTREFLGGLRQGLSTPTPTR